MFLGKIKDAFDRNPELQNLLLDDFFKTAVEKCQVSFQRRKNKNPAICSLNFCTLFPSQLYFIRKNEKVGRTSLNPIYAASLIPKISNQSSGYLCILPAHISEQELIIYGSEVSFIRTYQS